MTEDKWVIDIPEFTPKYSEKEEYGYKGKPGEKLEKLLRSTSKNHCMYCYSLLKNDRVNIGHLEHSIEKRLDEVNLTECVPNIAIACPNCNQSLKRKGESKRLEELTDAKKKFVKELRCNSKPCVKECEAYSTLKRKYCNISKIILQPFGVKGEKTKLSYRLQYDIYDAKFKPSERYNYSAEDEEYIKSHINRFKLNDADFKTKALNNFIEDVINSDGRYRVDSEYSNYIVDLFKEKIVELNQEETLELCLQIYTRNLLLFRN